MTERTDAAAAPMPAIVWVVTLAVHLATAGRYDFFRNELYFIDCGRHPGWSYADQPALVPLIAAATQIFGESLFWLRVPAALCAAALVPLTALLARELGGGAVVAAVAVASAIALTAITNTFGTTAFEPLGWTFLAYCATRAVQREDARPLLVAGIAAGLIFETKFGVAVWAAGLAAGLLVVRQRRLLLTRDAALGLAAATVISLPAIAWQIGHGLPFRAIVEWHSAEGVVFAGGAIRFWIGQVLALNLVLAPLWLTGLIAPWVQPRLTAARPVVVAFVVTALIVRITHGKSYYLYPAYPALFAAGAASLVQIARVWSIARVGWMILAVAQAAFLLPLSLPVLSPDALKAYLDRYHLHPRPVEAASVGAPITQLYSDQFAWRDLAAAVDRVFLALPAADRTRTGIFTWNYGEASAVDVFGRAPGLPRAMSGAAQFFEWGPEGDPRDLILVNIDRDAWAERCGSLQEVARFGNRFAMPYENDRPIYLCRTLKQPIATLWPGLRSRRGAHPATRPVG
jgi:hypothetical protein